MYILKTAISLTVDEVVEGSIKADTVWEDNMRENDVFEMPVLEIECANSYK